MSTTGWIFVTFNNQKGDPTGFRHPRLLPELIWLVYRGVRHRCELEAEHKYRGLSNFSKLASFQIAVGVVARSIFVTTKLQAICAVKFATVVADVHLVSIV